MKASVSFMKKMALFPTANFITKNEKQSVCAKTCISTGANASDFSPRSVHDETKFRTATDFVDRHSITNRVIKQRQYFSSVSDDSGG
jgi:hypothetical protein